MIPNLTRKHTVVCKNGREYMLAQKPELLWGVFCDREPVFKVILSEATCAGSGQVQLYYALNGRVIGDTHNDWDIVQVKNLTVKGGHL
jgi:hypothetical protein